MPERDYRINPNRGRPSPTRPIRRIRQDRYEQLDDYVLIEEPLEVIISGQRVAVLMRMPGQEKELAAGFCVSERYVRLF